MSWPPRSLLAPLAASATPARVLALALFLALTLLAVPAAAQDPVEDRVPADTVPVTEAPYPQMPAGDIIIRPNTGVEPTDPGDRGGSAQLALFVLTCIGVATIAALAIRQSRRVRAPR